MLSLLQIFVHLSFHGQLSLLLTWPLSARARCESVAITSFVASLSLEIQRALTTYRYRHPSDTSHATPTRPSYASSPFCHIFKRFSRKMQMRMQCGRDHSFSSLQVCACLPEEGAGWLAMSATVYVGAETGFTTSDIRSKCNSQPRPFSPDAVGRILACLAGPRRDGRTGWPPCPPYPETPNRPCGGLLDLAQPKRGYRSKGAL